MISESQKKRLLTAAVGLPVLALAVGFGGWPLLVLVAAASVVGQWEFYALLLPGRPVLAGAGLVLGAATVVSAVYGGWPVLAGAVLAAFWLEQLAFLGRFGFAGDRDLPRGALAAGILYVPSALRFILVFSPLETAFVLAVVMAVDTAAYYSGSLLGGPKIWPTVSPKKTWSGSGGGLTAGILVALCFGLLGSHVPALAWAGLGAAMAVVSQIGDFLESAMKRAAGVKDSGSLLPGHGGILDRVDGLLPAVLVYAALRPVFGIP